MIVIGVDGSPAGKEALRLGLHEASIRGTRARAVHAWSASAMIPVAGQAMIAPFDPTPYREAAAETLRATVEAVAGDKADRIERIVVESAAGPAIIENAHDAELIVVGRRGLGAIGSFVLGSVSAHVVSHATCPVLIVPTHR